MGGGGEEDTRRLGEREGWMKREKRHGDEEREGEREREEVREMKRKRQREKKGRGAERKRESSQTNRQLDIDSQIVVHVIAIKQISHTQTHFLYEM